MCLIVNKKRCPNGYKIAKKNIPCYKVLFKRHDGTFETPVRKQIVDITTGIEADRFQTRSSVSVIVSDSLIHKGVHSCTNSERAHVLQERLLRTRDACLYAGVIVLKAHIPKGTKYWVGKHHEFCSEDSFCKREIIFYFLEKQ